MSHTDGIFQLERLCELLDPFRSGPVNVDGLNVGWALRFSEVHGVRPNLLRALVDRYGATQEFQSLIAELMPAQKRIDFEALGMVSEISTLGRAFKGESVDAVFFKGAVLAQLLYGSPSMREYNDIDVIVRASQKHRAEQVLADCGFKPVIREPDLRTHFFEHLGQHPYRNDAGHVVDFHWKFTPEGVPFPLQERRIWTGTRPLAVGGVAVETLGEEDLALLLAGHGHKEDWASFSWVLDFARYASLHPDLDWEAIAHRAGKQHMVRPLQTAFALCRRLFAVDRSSTFALPAQTEISVDRHVNRICRRFAQLREEEVTPDMLSAFRMCETPLQRMYATLQLLTNRTIGDYDAAPVAKRWWWIYRFTRPVRLICRALLNEPVREGSTWAQRS